MKLEYDHPPCDKQQMCCVELALSDNAYAVVVYLDWVHNGEFNETQFSIPVKDVEALIRSGRWGRTPYFPTFIRWGRRLLSGPGRILHALSYKLRWLVGLR